MKISCLQMNQKYAKKKPKKQMLMRKKTFLYQVFLVDERRKKNSYLLPKKLSQKLQKNINQKKKALSSESREIKKMS